MRAFPKRLVARVIAGLDRAVTLAVRVGLSPSESDAPLDWGNEARLRFLEELAERYAGLELGGYFPEPAVIEPLERERGFFRRGLRRTDLSWPAAYAPFLPEMHQPYLRSAENGITLARLFRRERPRPVALLVHGYLLGRLAVEERVWPIARLDALGLDTALFILPFHGPRADPGQPIRPEFPGRDPRMANEGFRQGVTELRALMRWLRRAGHPAVGVLGMSLGGYLGALTATVESDMAFLVPIVPLASLPDFALEQGALAEAPELRAREHALLERVHQVVSPLHRPPRIAAERVLVVGAKADRITPLGHARRLANHFRAPLHAWHGSHIVQLGRGEAFRHVAELVTRLGVVEPQR